MASTNERPGNGHVRRWMVIATISLFVLNLIAMITTILVFTQNHC